MQPNIFSENIAGFYNVLRSILDEKRNPNIDYYEKEYGTDLNNYQVEDTILYLQYKTGGRIKLNVRCALLFIEGKVSVEEFYTEPVLENKLAGCVISEVIG